MWKILFLCKKKNNKFLSTHSYVATGIKTFSGGKNTRNITLLNFGEKDLGHRGRRKLLFLIVVHLCGFQLEFSNHVGFINF